MGFVFATCEPKRALEFINREHPESRDLTKEDIPLLYDLISRDILRVLDPDFHKPSQIIAGNNYSEDYSNEITDAINEMISKLE